MKKSTIIMIAVTIAFQVMLLSAVAYEASLGVKYNDAPITISEATDLKDISVDGPFSTLIVKKQDKARLFVTELRGIVVEHCDTITAPKVIIPKKLERYLAIDCADDTLCLSFFIPAEDTAKTSPNYAPWPRIECKDVITVVTPGKVNSFISKIGTPKGINVAFNSLANDSLVLDGTDIDATLNSCNISRLVCAPTARYKDNRQGYVNVCASNIGSITPRGNTSYISIKGDSLSTIGSVDWHSTIDESVKLDVEKATIGKVRFTGSSLTLSTDSVKIKDLSVQ